MKLAEKTRNCKPGVATHLLGGLFAAFTLLGLSFEKSGGLDLFFAEIWPAPVTIALGLTLFAAYDLGLAFLYGFLEGRLEKAQKVVKTAGRPLRRKRDHLYYWQAFGLIFLCWLPYLIIYYPGTVVPDGRRQVTEGLGMRVLTNMHPWLLSLIFGRIVLLGRLVSDNFGIFLLILLLALGQLACYSEVCVKLRQWNSPRWLQRLTVAWFGLYPLFGAYAQTLIKDGIATALTALFASHYMDLCIGDHQGLYTDRKRLLQKGLILILTGIACCLTRRNGFHIVLPLAVLLFLALRKGHRFLWIVVAGGITLGYLTNAAAGQALGVENGSARVFYSVMFQQTARTVKEEPQTLTRKRYRIINKVLKARKLAELYDPNLSDPVKNTFREKATPRQIRRYIRVWKNMGMYHPRIYAEAFFGGCYGYLYPFSFIDSNSSWYLDRKLYYTQKLQMDLHHPFSVAVRNYGAYYARAWRWCPGVRLLLRPGFWTWYYLVLLGWLCRRRLFKKLIVFAAPAVLTSIYCVSPVNGCLRYYLPMYAMAQLYLFWAVFEEYQYGQDRSTAPML